MEIILKKKEIENIVKNVAKKLTIMLKNEKKIPIFIGVMRGALNFMVDIIEHINMDIFTDYIHASSYSGEKTTNKVNIKYNPLIKIKNRTIVLIEDFIDTGFSINFLISFLKKKYNPAKIILVSLLERESAKKTHINIDIVGKKIKDNRFLIGYGLDFMEIGRNYKNIYAYEKNDLNKLKNRIKSGE